MVNVAHIIENLDSEKVTERKDALKSLSDLFNQDHVVATFHIDKSSGKAKPLLWAAVFQGLFKAVRKEKKSFVTKATGPNRTRLDEVAKYVRILTQKATPYMTTKVTRILFIHLRQEMVHNGTLLDPVALHYVKALRHLLEWTPHLDRLDADQWVALVELGFNVVMGDPLRTAFINDPTNSDPSPAPGTREAADDSEFYEDDSDASSMVSPSKKRPSSTHRSKLSKRRSVQVSPEQIDFVPILAILLRSSSAPLLLKDCEYLPSSILDRLQRFLEIYPADVSLYHDYLLTVLAALSHLSLNRKDLVVRFAQGSWQALVSLWGTKDKTIKEGLVAVLRVLFPFLTAGHENSSYDWSEGIGHLWRFLDGEAGSRWGVDGLSLECLRLEIADPDDRVSGDVAFVTRTFQAGWNFDPGQALAWAILELQADCAEKLFQHSENNHSQRGVKRSRSENPITSLLESMQRQTQSHVRAYHLQTLLFFIDRHWSVLHDTLQQTVFSALIQFISFDDPLVQSWTFLCFAAIATSDSHPGDASKREERDWDTIWAHAIRPCQAAYALLLHSNSHSESATKLLLTPQPKDLDVQGPPFPYDSVCVFLQDARLYRMQFEEKALTWLVDCWSVRASVNMPPHMVKDVMLLLETICCLSKRSDLFCRVILPECMIVEILIIRDYLLTTTLPDIRNTHRSNSSKASVDDSRRIGPRERKALASDMELLAQGARRSLDWAVISLSFEAVLALNGTRPNRRVLQAACKLMLLKAVILLSFEPLVSTGETDDEDVFSMALISPDTLQLFTSQERKKPVASRRDMQRLVCQSADVQDGFEAIAKVLRKVLRFAVGSSQGHALHAPDDGFGPSTTHRSHETTKYAGETSCIRCIAEVCTSFLTVVPILQSASGEPTNDKELIELAITCVETFTVTSLLVCHIILSHVKRKTLALSKVNLGLILEELGEPLQSYQHGRSEACQNLAVHLLDCTLHIWTTTTVDHVRLLCSWLSDALRGSKSDDSSARTSIRAWKTRDALARLFDGYLKHDAAQAAWFNKDEDEARHKNGLPTKMLPSLNEDDDIRVRFRSAVLNAHLFAIDPATQVYQSLLSIYMSLIVDSSDPHSSHERMLTRLLSLGNVMIVSSAARRGAYWNLLESSLLTPLYFLHTQAVLNGVSQRLGLRTFSLLFEAYASQLAFAIKEFGSDFLRLPPRLLGYKDRRECAVANFSAFTPTNLVSAGQHPGERLFEGHCKVIQKSLADGIRDCFADIVAYQILKTLLDLEQDGEPIPTEELGYLLLEKTMNDDNARFHETLRENVDGVVTWIVRSLGDQNFLPQAFEPHEPNVPSFPSSVVLRALSWFDSFEPDTDGKATAYHVRSPLVNEQLRLINALCLWIAFRHESFQDSTLLHAVIRGATSLMAYSDLARAAQSILEWVFDCYRMMRADNARFPDVLIRIACFANDYARKSHLPLQTLGNDLRQWIDGQVLALSAVGKSLRQSAKRALSAWPHTPSSGLMELFNSFTSAQLSVILSDASIMTNKFRMVRQLRNRAAAADSDTAQFAETDFWRLRECIPPPYQLQDADVDAFASLLVFHQGHISSFGSEQPISTLVRSKQRRGINKLSSRPQHWVIHVLLSMLEASDVPQVHVAYRTLRSLMAVSPPDISAPFPSEYREELVYLQAYKRPPNSRPDRKIEELVGSDIYLNAVGDFPRWIGMIATLLSDILSVVEPFYGQLALILQSDAAFTEQMLPVLVHTILQSEQSELVGKDGASLANINLPCRSTLSQYFTAVLKSADTSLQCLQSIVDIVLHLRNFAPDAPASKKADALAYDKWLVIDYTLLASKAIVCGAYTTALLFLELAVEYAGDVAADDRAAEQILYDIYSHIDEPDGFYGIKTQDLHQFLIKRFHHEKQWEKAFRFHSAALEAGSTATRETDGLLQSFHSFGFNHLAIDTLQSSSFGTGATFNSPSMNYRLGWRTETWDLPDCKGEQSPGAPLYLALRANVVHSAISEEMGRIRGLGSENLAEIRDATQTLMCLNQVAQWFHPTHQDRLASRHVDISQWADFINLPSGFEFSDFENIMATRISLVRSVRRKEERQQIGTMVSPFSQCLVDVEKQCLIRLSRAAREANQIQIALNSVIRAQTLEPSPSLNVSEEFASVLHLHKEEKLAVQFLKDLELTGLSQPEKAVILARLGTWMAEACLENPTDISSRYFEPASSFINQFRATSDAKLPDSHAAVYRQYAIFADHQYKTLRDSAEADRMKSVVERTNQEIKTRDGLYRQTPTLADNAKALNAARTRLKEEKQLYQKHASAREAFLAHAIDMYSRSLETSDAFDGDGAIRLCSLWFENFDVTDIGFQDNVRVALDRVPSHKLLFLAHQLSARLSRIPDSAQTQETKNQENLQSVVKRMCMEHPFHSLYQVYSLLPLHLQEPSNRRQSGRHNSPSSQTERAAAATNLFERFRADIKCAQRVRDIELVANACLEWATFKIRKTALGKMRHTQARNIPENMLLHKIKNIKVPVLTIHTEIDLATDYTNCVFIARFEATFMTAGGVNLPKICKCVGEDGVAYKQMFKGEGNDDLRQDAVMEQVFDLVNTVLQGDRETERRSLRARSYKIIPLGSQAGVMQFVDNTQCLLAWLNYGHRKYRPDDWLPDDARKYIDKTFAEYTSQPKKLLVRFQETKEHFHPVLRHFFTEKHKIPLAWYAMRLNYVRSVATTSIVGHILGLGDRHGSNILLDEHTGEVVHIDLGIAFDQGKLLAVPELVPFRMTSDVVDGMGTTGTQGVFQRCAEETLRVLREGSEIIMTVLEVFKHDPLHSWTASEIKLNKVQNVGSASRGDNRIAVAAMDDTSGTADDAAERALMSVRRKLDKSLSVEYTVNELIAEATDPMKLAAIFPGWGAIF
ncbi:hypothetical protein C8J57DRAFT_1559254 [Mycena rebaudengoi]|nr:hypothetical protein C8J57DRAFT_1559254 [Mycena rebaudengoi]